MNWFDEENIRNNDKKVPWTTSVFYLGQRFSMGGLKWFLVLKKLNSMNQPIVLSRPGIIWIKYPACNQHATGCRQTSWISFWMTLKKLSCLASKILFKKTFMAFTTLENTRGRKARFRNEFCYVLGAVQLYSLALKHEIL